MLDRHQERGARIRRILSAPGLAVVPALLLGAASGCVERTIRITSDPSGALVWLNDREVGRTPLEVKFVHYGTYDVRLVLPGYETLLTSGDATPPLWDNVPLDLFAEILPFEAESRVAWHYTLEPTIEDPEALRAALLERARELRARAGMEEADAGGGGGGSGGGAGR